MITVRKTYGGGGAGLGSTPTAHHRPIAEVLRGLIDDIEATGGGITISAADSVAATSADGVAAAGGAPDKAEFDVVVTLVNELKAKYNVAVTLLNEVKTDLNAAGAAPQSVVKG